MEWLGLIVAVMLVGFILLVPELFRRVVVLRRELVGLRVRATRSDETVIVVARDMKEFVVTLADRVVAAEKQAAAALHASLAFNARLEAAEVSLAELQDLRGALRKVAARNRDLLKQPVA